MRILNLKMEAFRGIPKMLELDFRTPITIVYAPNGTGKTTICDAIEWLLTGDIRRLNAPPESEETEIRCSFSSSDIATCVTATLEVDQEEIVVTRDFSRLRWKRQGDQFRSVTPSKLLELVAPSAVEQGTHARHATVSRRTWLRGNRFLSGESLSALLDSDEESVESRQRVFADLLGVGHLLETERQLETYSTHMASLIKQQKILVDAKKTEITRKEAEFEKAASESEENLRTVAASVLDAAREKLELTTTYSEYPPLLATLRKVATETRSEIYRRRAVISAKQSAEVELASEWPNRLSHENRLTDDNLAIAEWQKRLDGLSARREVLKRLLDDFDRRYALLATQAEEIDAHFEAIQAPLDVVPRAGGGSISLTEVETMTLAGLLESAPRRKPKDIQNQIRILVSLRDQLPMFDQLKERRASLESEIALLSAGLPNDVEEQQTRSALIKAKEIFTECGRRYNELVGPLEQLRLLAKSVGQKMPNDSTCPTCAHNWESHARLLEAMNNAALSTPMSAQTLSEDVRMADSEVAKLSSELDHIDALRAEIGARTKIVIANNTQISNFSQRFQAAGLEPLDPELSHSLQMAVDRCSLDEATLVLADEIAEIERITNDTISRNTLITELRAAVEKLVSDFRARNKLERDETATAAEPIRLENATVGSDIQLGERERLLIANRIEIATTILQRLRSAWDTLAGAVPWTEEALRDALEARRRDSEFLSELESLLAQAEQLTAEATRRSQMTELQRDLLPLTNEFDRLTGLANSAASAAAAYRRTRLDYVKEQMGGIVQVISALFLRLQANEVYERIVAGSDEEPLSWRALSDGFLLNPETKFSQGQRQDFALSIFLARARGLLGSFFLDEPLAHLDDLNRVALLDVFRVIALERNPKLAFILTTASRATARHIAEKFARCDALGLSSASETQPLFRIVELEGNPRVGVKLTLGGIGAQ